MMFAARASHWNIVKLLVENGSNINKTRSMYYFMEGSHPSPLMYACAQGDMSAVNEVLALGANVNVTAWETYVPTLHDSPVISACVHGHLEVVQFLLAQWNFRAYDTVAYALVEACEL